ncbi:RagB/SusD family nutrient uptake outer membrane protein [Pontibacter sp. G13]|uniref:RagB/SusD family nutrient uptake outer membrane protein n=1 Tax=Pontibacter sp. G13 TaxID=3074898 RepID=UPI00288B600B|nr:RagB/SusD family nutrient uptake outer membrane protein [Pontibacter sp. G13]WNJ20067.1 RagB/SusD family nutrient uptake outer membrane protein [Pontibacter sp. G13]
MKKFAIYLSSVMLATAGLQSCQDLLVEEPTIFVAPETFYEDESDAQIALNGAYGTLQDDWIFDFVGFPTHWGNKGVDEINAPNWAGGGRKELHLYQLTPTMPIFENLWRAHFRAVNTCNGVIDRVAAMSEEQIVAESQERIIAEARFLRGLIYFNLVKMFGNVPLVTSEVVSLDNLEIPQTSEAEVYDQIIEDLQFAATVLEEGQGGGRATKGAAQALLGKVYLQMTGWPLMQTEKFAMAAAQFEEVINSGVYSLQANYTDVFDYNNDQNSEIVFAVGFEGPGLNEGSSLGTYMGPNGRLEYGGGYGTEYINNEFALSYEEGDTRRAQNVADINVNNPENVIGQANWRPWKWKKPNPNNFLYDAPFDMPIIRFADVLLCYAEALNGVNGAPTAAAFDAVNEVRARARGEASADTVLIPLAGLNHDEFVDALVYERRWELCFEGHRKDDLIRMGKLEEVLARHDEPQWSNAGNPYTDYRPYKRKFPVPTREMDLNSNLVQTEGYD